MVGVFYTLCASVMTFPQTRLTLVGRLASGGSPEDWGRFLKDYWGPVCRFALRFGAKNLDDAEDVASQTFEVIWENRLLVRWVSNRSAKLRSLLCSVTRKTLANRNRRHANRQRLFDELLQHPDRMMQVPDELADGFYAAWVEDLLQQAVDALAAEYYAQDKGDYLRVFYSRLYERLTIAEVAQALEIKPSAVDYYFRHVRDRLGAKLAELLRDQITRCSLPAQLDHEFTDQWAALGQYLSDHGGLEEAFRRSCDALDPVLAQKSKQAALAKTVARLTSIGPPQSGVSDDGDTT